MKTKPSILQQLLVNILLPVLVLFSLVFVLVYQYNRTNLETEIEKQKSNIVGETKNLIAYYDFAMRTHELSLTAYMQQKSIDIEAKLSTNSPTQAQLNKLRNELGMDSTREEIYLIDKKYRIINTTYRPDLGLDFSKIDQTFVTFFGTIFKEKRFKEDRFGLEISTGKIRKYSYYPVKNGNYIIELGIYSKEADEYKALLLEKIKSLNKRYQSIRDVTLYLGVKNVVDVTIKDSASKQAYIACLQNEKAITIDADNPQIPGMDRKEFIFLPVMDAALYSGYVLQLNTNDYVYQELLSDLFFRFSIFFLIAILLIAAIVYIRSRKITQPIFLLAKATQGITSDNLGKHIAISGSKEIDELAASFNSMMDNLRVSYDTLEDKVIERTQELNEQKKVVEHKNQEILESINYARFIQQALLPLESEIQAVFPESFVYYAPKDIIAGDFYWFEKRNHRTWFAVADCTGHGVPGAMVSVLCINALVQSLSEKPDANTGELLNLVRDKVVQTLTKEARSVKDGMDISIACYDESNHSLEWSGANNPLWIIRQEELLVVDADKQPIGQFEYAKPFTSHHIQLEKNDWIILFSDGYADQFGGPKNKKYKYATLKSFLLAQDGKNAIEIKSALKDEFETWKGKEEQTDDVCVMGIQVS